jgi:hypothetical protein
MHERWYADAHDLSRVILVLPLAGSAEAPP